MSKEKFFDFLANEPSSPLSSDSIDDNRNAGIQLHRELRRAIANSMGAPRSHVRSSKPQKVNSPPKVETSRKRKFGEEAQEGLHADSRADFRTDDQNKMSLEEDPAWNGIEADEEEAANGSPDDLDHNERDLAKRQSGSKHSPDGQHHHPPQKHGQQSVAVEVDEDAESADSDNEAPETVTAEAGFEASRAISGRTARVLERQQAELRAKRKEHDARLKAQARQSDSKKTEGNISMDDDDEAASTTPSHIDKAPDTNTQKQNQNRSKRPPRSRREPIPEFLPNDLLESDPPPLIPPQLSHPTSSQPIDKKKKNRDNKKITFRDGTSKAPRPRDIRQGGKRTIRVLPREGGPPHDGTGMTSVSLPPKASTATSRRLREAWLLGIRRGGGGGVSVPRRKVGGGRFLRR